MEAIVGFIIFVTFLVAAWWFAYGFNWAVVKKLSKVDVDHKGLVRITWWGIIAGVAIQVMVTLIVAFASVAAGIPIQ